MLRGLFWEPAVVPSYTWLFGWIRRGEVLEEVAYTALLTRVLHSTITRCQLYLTWAQSLFLRPLTFFSFPLAYALLSLCLTRDVWVCLFKGGSRVVLTRGLLHGQSRRWSPVGFFVRWWAVSTAALVSSPLNTNRPPHDYWLGGSAVFFACVL